MKLLNMIVGIIGGTLSIYLIYLASTGNEIFVSILRAVGAVLLICLTIIVFKDRNITPDQRVKKWYKDERPKGFLRFLLKAIMAWGMPVGFILWLLKPGVSHFDNFDNLLFSLLKQLILYAIFGIVIGWTSWNTNEKKAIKIKSEICNENEGEYRA